MSRTRISISTIVVALMALVSTGVASADQVLWSQLTPRFTYRDINKSCRGPGHSMYFTARHTNGKLTSGEFRDGRDHHFSKVRLNAHELAAIVLEKDAVGDYWITKLPLSTRLLLWVFFNVDANGVGTTTCKPPKQLDTMGPVNEVFVFKPKSAAVSVTSLYSFHGKLVSGDDYEISLGFSQSMLDRGSSDVGAGTLPSKNIASIELRPDFEYQDLTKACSLAVAEKMMFSARVANGKVIEAKFHHGQHTTFPKRIAFTADELKGIELGTDSIGDFWLKTLPLSPRLINWLAFNFTTIEVNGPAICRPSKALKTLGPNSYTFVFSVKSATEYTSPRIRFQGQLADGSPYHFKIGFLQRPANN